MTHVLKKITVVVALPFGVPALQEVQLYCRYLRVRWGIVLRLERHQLLELGSSSA
jgi:hypothetical protein